MEVTQFTTRSLFAALTLTALIAGGCSSGGTEDYDPSKIAVKQDGPAPKPGSQPMAEGQTAPNTSGK